MYQNTFRITDGKDRSLDEISLHQLQGGSVLRSAHVWNFNPVTLFLAQKWVPIILHEFIKWDAPIYEPAFLKMDGQKIQISEQPGFPLTHDHTLIRDRIRDILDINGDKYTRPAQVHFRSLEKLPGSQIQLSSEFLLWSERLNDFLRILAKTHPHQFWNYIFEDGTVLNSESAKANNPQRFFNADQEIILHSKEMADAAYENLYATVQAIRNGVKRNSQWIIFRSNLYILLSTLADFFRLNGDPSEEWEAIHFSGSQMMNYMIRNKQLATENQQEINEMFQVLRKEFPQELPISILFQLVPTEWLWTMVSTWVERKLLQESILKMDASLQELFTKRWIFKEAISKEVRNIVMNMSDQEIYKEVNDIFSDIKSLPSWLRKLADQTHAMLHHPDKAEEIRKNLINFYPARSQTMKNCDELHEIEGEIEMVKKQILDTQSQSNTIQNKEISQYDILFGSKNIFVPEWINKMPMHNIQSHLKYVNKLTN